MASKVSTREGNIREFVLHQAKDGGNSIDASGAVVDIKYYEDVLSNSVSLSVIITESGESDNKKMGNKGILDGLPVRGGEPATIVIEDHDGHKLSFKNESKLYVNRVRNVIPGTQKDVYSIDFTSRELFANEQCRVVRRYDGKISENIKEILEKSTSGDAGIKTKKKVSVDDSNSYNFIGNDRKPFYVCTWLASKAAPSDGSLKGGTAGYLFYETYDGFNFRSIDLLFKQKSKGNYLFSNTDYNPKEYDGKIITYDIDRNIDLQNNLMMGTYSNRSLFFDFYAMNYQVRNFNVDSTGAAKSDGGGSKGKIVTAGTDDIDSVADEFRKPISRLMNRVLDVGTLPPGKDIEAQLKAWKENPDNATYDAADIMVQSIMRYNQLFTVKTEITIPGDFTIKAGDLVECSFPALAGDESKEVNSETKGIYMVASVCHRITPNSSTTSLSLVRDSFGGK